MMDAKLKAILIEAITAVERQHQEGCEKRPSWVAKNALKLAKSASLSCEKRALDLRKTQVFVYQTVRRRLVNTRRWKKIETEFAREGIDRIVADLVRRRQRATEDPTQIQLPGFEHLPFRVRIRVGEARQSIILARMTVTQFLAYKLNYEQRNARNLGAVTEMARLAQMIEAIAKDHPDITVAEALDRANVAVGRPRLAVVASLPSR
jgi:hypothetical protein